MEKYKVRVIDGDNAVEFLFNNLGHASEFAGNAYEVCNDTAIVELSKKNESEEL